MMNGGHSVLPMRLQSGSGGVISGMRGKVLQEITTLSSKLSVIPD